MSDLTTRKAGFLIGAVLPTAIVLVANVNFILNHFYARAPYLLDSGWGSALVYRAGVSLHNPQIACEYANTFYGVHMSPFLALVSLLSYLAPVERIEWYAFFQGVVYAPLGFVAYAVRAPGETRSLKGHLMTMVWSLAFAFSAQVIICIHFPHFEPVIAGLLCLLLTCIVTGRRRLSWILLALTISVREDAGLHAAFAILPLSFLEWRGTSVTASRKTLLKLVGVALGGTVLAFVVQKTFFPAPGLFRTEYLGRVPLAHLTMDAVFDRSLWVIKNCPYVVVPFGASVLIAIFARDPRYLLGWLATAPWFLVNFLAFQNEKWQFAGYAGFPFLVAFFWVYLYGVRIAPPQRRMKRWRLEGLLTAASITGLALLVHGQEAFVRDVTAGLLRSEPQQPASVRALGRLLREHHDELGRLSIDEPVAALAIEVMTHRNFFRRTPAPETFVLHRHNSVADTTALLELAKNDVPQCLLVDGTYFLACTKSEQASKLFATLKTTPLPSGLAFTSFDLVGRQIGFEGRGVVIHKGSAPGLVATSTNIWIYPGEYEAVWDLSVEDAADAIDGELGAIEMLLAGQVASRRTIGAENAHQQLVFPLTVASQVAFSWRFSISGTATIVIEAARLRVIPVP